MESDFNLEAAPPAGGDHGVDRHRGSSSLARRWFGWLLVALLPMAAAGELVKDWKEVVLRVGDREVKPLAVPDPPLWGKRFDEGWVDLSKDNTIQVRSDTGEVLREIALPAGCEVAVTSDERVVVAYPEQLPDGGSRLVGWISQPGMIGPGRLRTLRQVGDAEWNLLGATVVAGREGFLLGKRRNEDRVAYEKIVLQAFSGESDEPVLSWEQALTGGEVRLPGAMLWASREPRQAIPGLLPLVPCGDAFLVTPGPQEAIYCIDPAKPDMPIRWKLEKPWEFRRGFTGPSVWSHHLSRFGMDPFDFDGQETVDWESFVEGAIKGVTREFREEYRKKAEADMAEFKKVEADLKRRCQMTGGPFVVPAEGPSAPTIFVAIAESEDSGQWGRYLAHTIIYEIDARSGMPFSMIRLARNTLGSEAVVRAGGLIWRCEENGIARLQPSRIDEINFGPGGPDCIGKLRSYSEGTPRRRDAWLSSPAIGSAYAWSDAGLIVDLDDSWIEKKGDKLLHMPFHEMRPGLEQSDFELVVPLAKSPDGPETNYSGTGDGKIRTHSAYLLGITAFETWGERLYVTLGFEGGHRTLVFDETWRNPQAASAPGKPDTKPDSE